MIRLRNKWVEMDPRQWNSDMDVAISVGLGLGNKAEQLTTAQGVLELYERLAPTPFATLIDKEKVYNAVKKFLNAAGIKNIDDFVNEPQKDEQGNLVQEPPAPDPKMIEMQAKAQIEAAKTQAKAQADQAEAERKLQETLAKIHLAEAEAQSKAQLEQAKAMFEARLAEQKFEFEAALAAKEARLNEEISRRDADREDEISKNREGGDLSE